MAASGLFPGLKSTLSIANLGHFEREVIIEPVVRSGGGGYVRAPIGMKPDRYRVTVRVKFKGKWHEETRIVDDNEARVEAKINGIKVFTENDVMISVNGVQVKKPMDDLAVGARTLNR